MSVQLFEGDCLEVMKQIPASGVDMILCDLPYGVTARNSWDAVLDWSLLWREYARITKETSPIVLTATQPFASACVMSNPEWFKYEWIWRKQQGTGFLNAKKQPLRNHEQVLVFYRKQPIYNPQMTEGRPYRCVSGKGSLDYGQQIPVLTENKGERCPLTVQDFSYDKNKIHPTQKPVQLMEYLIKTYTNEGDTVLDNCMGSGTTGVACVNLNRNFIGIEKDPKYFQIAKDRIEKAEFGF